MGNEVVVVSDVTRDETECIGFLVDVEDLCDGINDDVFIHPILTLE